MNRRGVCYDVGRVMMGQNWRPVFDLTEMRRELQIIREDLHCNAIRICGQDVDRLVTAGSDAIDLGLEIWISPELWDHTPVETLDYVVEAARRAEELRQRRPDRVVFSVGSELTLFMRGILEGDTFLERLHHPSFRDTIRSGAHNAPLDVFLAEPTDAVHQVFKGSVTSPRYRSRPWTGPASTPWPSICTATLASRTDSPICCAGSSPTVARSSSPSSGCCTYKGAADAGAMGWAIVDFDQADYGKRPPELKGVFVRDEGEQARELTEVLAIFEEAGVDGAFVFTFVAPTSPTSEDPKFDLDMASYSLVKSYGNRLGDLASGFPNLLWDASRSGVTYPDMPWEPKQSFGAVADFYGPRHDSPDRGRFDVAPSPSDEGLARCRVMSSNPDLNQQSARPF